MYISLYTYFRGTTEDTHDQFTGILFAWWHSHHLTTYWVPAAIWISYPKWTNPCWYQWRWENDKYNGRKQYLLRFSFFDLPWLDFESFLCDYFGWCRTPGHNDYSHDTRLLCFVKGSGSNQFCFTPSMLPHVPALKKIYMIALPVLSVITREFLSKTRLSYTPWYSANVRHLPSKFRQMQFIDIHCKFL